MYAAYTVLKHKKSKKNPYQVNTPLDYTGKYMLRKTATELDKTHFLKLTAFGEISGLKWSSNK